MRHLHRKTTLKTDAIQPQPQGVLNALKEMNRYFNHIHAYTMIGIDQTEKKKKTTGRSDRLAVERDITSFQLKKIAMLFERLNLRIMSFHRCNKTHYNPYQGIEYRKLSALIKNKPVDVTRNAEKKKLLAIINQFKRYRRYVIQQSSRN
jgi:hypothetical protein